MKMKKTLYITTSTNRAISNYLFFEKKKSESQIVEDALKAFIPEKYWISVKAL